MPLAELRSLGNLAFVYLAALTLAGARLSGLAVVMPVFTRLGLTAPLRTGAMLALALPLAPHVANQLGASVLADPLRLATLTLKEGIVGIALGLIFGVPFWAAEAAGNIIDLQRGSTAGMLVDPSAASETSVTGTLFVITLVTLFFISGGMTLVVGGVFDSYRFWPIEQFLPSLSADTPLLFLDLLDRIMRLSLALAGPLVVVMFLADAMLALVARAAPQLNAFDLSFSVKSLIVVLLLPVYVAFLIAYGRDDLAQLLNVMPELGRVFATGQPP